MGGCYSYSDCQRNYEPSWKTSFKREAQLFLKNGNIENLINAYRSFFDTNNSGFIQQLLTIKSIDEAPKEFPEMEYEIKFNIDVVEGRGKELGMKEYLNAFDFPPSNTARFLKDPCNNITEGVNHFLGDGIEERLVVIEKMGKLFLKEKGPPVPLNLGIPYENIVIKRTEKRWEAPLDEVIEKVGEVEKGGSYKGKIRKEKGDIFILDTSDGRIYSFTINRSHIRKDIQRQLEIEYAGYVPGFQGFDKNSEKQIVSGMIDLARYIAVLYHNAPIANGWKMQLSVTNERKYDFVAKTGGKKCSRSSLDLTALEKLPLSTELAAKAR